MNPFKTLTATLAITLIAGSALAADSMKSDAMMKKQSAAMEKCEAMGAKARAKRMCMAMMKKHAAMKPDAMTGDGMRSDAMKGDHMSSEGHH